jgi:hypothetical protein
VSSMLVWVISAKQQFANPMLHCSTESIFTSNRETHSRYHCTCTQELVSHRLSEPCLRHFCPFSLARQNSNSLSLQGAKVCFGIGRTPCINEQKAPPKHRNSLQRESLFRLSLPSFLLF